MSFSVQLRRMAAATLLLLAVPAHAGEEADPAQFRNGSTPELADRLQANHCAMGQADDHRLSAGDEEGPRATSFAPRSGCGSSAATRIAPIVEWAGARLPRIDAAECCAA